MGNHDYDPNLLRALDDLDLPGVPVEKGEWNRVLASARGQVNAKQPGRKARRSRPLLRLVRSAAVAACSRHGDGCVVGKIDGRGCCQVQIGSNLGLGLERHQPPRGGGGRR